MATLNDTFDATIYPTGYTGLSGTATQSGGDLTQTSAATPFASAYTGVTFGTNQSTSITWKSGGTNGSGAYFRLNTGTFNGFRYLFKSTGDAVVQRIDGGVPTDIRTVTGLTIVDGDVLGCTVSGNTFQLTQNGTNIGLSVTDATYPTGGSPGIALDDSGAAIHAWSVDDGVTGAINVTPGVGAIVIAGVAPSVVATTSGAPPRNPILVVKRRHARRRSLARGSLLLIGTINEPPNPISVLPGVGAVTVASVAPAVFSSNNQSVLPSVGAVTIASVAPTVVATANSVVLPGTGAVGIASAAPSVVSSGNVALIPGVGQVRVQGFAPAIISNTNQQVLPGTGQVGVAGLAPTITALASQSVLPDVGLLSVVGFPPTISIAVGNQSVFPGVGGVIITGYAPLITIAPVVSVLAFPFVRGVRTDPLEKIVGPRSSATAGELIDMARIRHWSFIDVQLNDGAALRWLNQRQRHLLIAYRDQVRGLVGTDISFQMSHTTALIGRTRRGTPFPRSDAGDGWIVRTSLRGTPYIDPSTPPEPGDPLGVAGGTAGFALPPEFITLLMARVTYENGAQAPVIVASNGERILSNRQHSGPTAFLQGNRFVPLRQSPATLQDLWNQVTSFTLTYLELTVLRTLDDAITLPAVMHEALIAGLAELFANQSRACTTAERSQFAATAVRAEQALIGLGDDIVGDLQQNRVIYRR